MEQTPFNNEKKTRPVADAAVQRETPSKPTGSEAGKNAAHRGRWVAGIVAALLMFLAGFVPMWLKAGRQADERDAARREVKSLSLESLAAAAAVDSRRGEYESARQAASQFFTALRADLDAGPGSFLSAAQQAELKPLLTQRDGLITLLARSDPAAAERLTEVYLACRKSLRGG